MKVKRKCPRRNQDQDRYNRKEGHGKKLSCGKTETDREAWLSDNPHTVERGFRNVTSNKCYMNPDQKVSRLNS
jgi:hypothetical protein